MHFGRDVKGLNIPQHRDVKLNELPKQIFMLLPLLLHWLYVSILGGGMPSRMKKEREKESQCQCQCPVLISGSFSWFLFQGSEFIEIESLGGVTVFHEL